MTLHIDARRRAMLAEMGVRVWLPMPKEAEPAALVVPAAREKAAHDAALQPMQPMQPMQPDHAVAVPAREAASPAPVVSAPPHQVTRPEPPVAPPPAPLRVQADPPASLPPAASHSAADASSAPALAGLPWPALQQAASSCTACALHSGRQHSVWDASAANEPDGLPRWLFVLDPPGQAENTSGQPLQGDAGRLLANMAAAVRLQPAQILRSHATRCAPAGRAATLPEVAQCAAYLRHEIALLRPQVIVALGRNAAWSLLQRTEPLGQLRGQLHRIAVPAGEAALQPVLADIPVIVSYPLDYLLRNAPAKARAWEDLCLAALHAASAPTIRA